eukprot:10287518-Lingulodinium_polyedra.AAC.1
MPNHPPNSQQTTTYQPPKSSTPASNSIEHQSNHMQATFEQHSNSIRRAFKTPVGRYSQSKRIATQQPSSHPTTTAQPPNPPYSRLARAKKPPGNAR